MCGLTLSIEQWETLCDYLQTCLPEEGCGLFGGSAGEVQAVLPVTNELHSPVRFRMVPQEQLEKFNWLEEQALELVGIFHSHPNGPSHPSATDLAEFAYPGVVSVICWPGESGWKAKAYQIEGISCREVALEVGCGAHNES